MKEKYTGIIRYGIIGAILGLIMGLVESILIIPEILPRYVIGGIFLYIQGFGLYSLLLYHTIGLIIAFFIIFIVARMLYLCIK